MRISVKGLVTSTFFISINIFSIFTLATPENQKHPAYLGSIPAQQSVEEAIMADGPNVQKMLKDEALSRERYNKSKRYERKSEFLALLPKHLRETQWGCNEIRCMKGILSTIGESEDLNRFQPYSAQILEWVWATQDHSWADEYIINRLMQKIDSPVAKLLLDIKRSAVGQLDNQKLRIKELSTLSRINSPTYLVDACKDVHSIQDSLAYMFNKLYKPLPICVDINAVKKPEEVDTHKWIEGNALKFNLSQQLDAALKRYRKLSKAKRESHPLKKLYAWQAKSSRDELFDEISKTVELAKQFSITYNAWFYLRPQLLKDLGELKNGEVALQYLRYKKESTYGMGTYEYLAFVIKNKNGKIQSSIHKAASQFSIEQENRKFRKLLYTRQFSNELKVSGARLFELLLRPVWSEIESADKIYIAGMDNTPFHLLYSNKKGPPLLASKNISYFNVWDAVSARFLNSAGLQNKTPSNKPALFGNPHFGSYLGTNATKIKTYDNLRGNEGFPFPFSALKNTEKEIHQVLSLSPKQDANVFLGDKASEMAFYNVKNPDILHIASHAYFYRDSAGIAFSNSNLGLDGDLISDGFDGIVTDSEIAVQELQGTQLAVLSACDTGSGSQTSGNLFYGDNISGLASAFHNAGVEKILMSHWNVDDEATAMFMGVFYERYFTLSDTAKALQETQQFLMKKLARTKQESPYFWGAFTLREQPFEDGNIDKATLALVKKAQSGKLEAKYLTSRKEQINYVPYSAENIPSYTGTANYTSVKDKNVWQHDMKEALAKEAYKSLDDKTYDPCTDTKYEDELEELQSKISSKMENLTMMEQLKKMTENNLKIAELIQKIAKKMAACS